jgi:heme/copper-type cytochrome/quinol oxidase subunit 2
MSIWCAIPIVIALTISYFTIYSMGKVAGKENLQRKERDAETR